MLGRIKRFFKSDKFQAFLEGYSMAFDIFPVPYRKLYEDDPAEAMRKDWEAIASDMNKVLNDFDITGDNNHESRNLRNDESRS